MSRAKDRLKPTSDPDNALLDRPHGWGCFSDPGGGDGGGGREDDVDDVGEE